VCKETQTDNDNCGTCGKKCNTPSEKCVAGACVTCDPPCTGLDVCCDLTCCKVCCGAEGSKICCAEGKLCDNGQCTGCDPECTEAGQTCCAGSTAGPEPSPDQVGACCNPGIICCNGNCCGDSVGPVPMYCCDNQACCYEGIACCDGKCCGADEFCDNGVCASCNPLCYPDEKCCDGTCIRWQCGDCPNACTRFQTCTNNVCCSPVTEGPQLGSTGVGCGTVCCYPGITCCRDICCLDPLEECCDGFCTDVRLDSNLNCGGCNQPCTGPLEEGWQCCSGNCTNTASRSTDEYNCGGCHVTCGESQHCVNGNCVTL